MSQCGDATTSAEFWPLVCPVAQAGRIRQGNVLRSIFGLILGRQSGKRSVTVRRRGGTRGNARAGEVAAGDVGLDQAGRRGARRRFDAEVIDLGNEPPLLVDGGSGGLLDRRRLSVQWFSGTILTGLCGAALMGGAVFASLDGETNFASAPERVEMALRGAISGIGERLSTFRKADRLPAMSEPSVTRQSLRVPTLTRVRDRELVRTRAFVRVSGNLSPTLSDLSANIPAFNPQKLLTDSV